MDATERARLAFRALETSPPQSGIDSLASTEIRWHPAQPDNLLATVDDGPVLAEARLHHAGRRTQVWDAVVAGEQAGRAIALFRCTQMILYQQAAHGLLAAAAMGANPERDLDAR